MALPWELEEEILCRLPPRSLVRFRAVCKRWNSLLKEKSFLKNQFGRVRPQLIFLTESKVYSIGIDLGGVDPTIEVCELPYDFPCQIENLQYTTISACDELLFRYLWGGLVAVWNPWLRQVVCIQYKEKAFYFCGAGYNSSKPEKGYMILGFFHRFRIVSANYKTGYDRFCIYECASQALKFIDSPFDSWPAMGANPLSVNGNLFWIGYDDDSRQYIIQSFDFSMLIFIKNFCLLPCQKIRSRNQLILSVFEGDRLSLLNQCFATGRIEIWVTNKKIGREQVVWMTLMTFPTTNLPKLVNKGWGISYFIFDKTLIVCCSDNDEAQAACIYILRGRVFKKIPIDSGSVLRFSHCVYLPNLIPLPSDIRSLQV